MFRPMRRSKQKLSLSESLAILQNGSYGILAVSGDHDYPYTVPLNYVYQSNKLFFHCAKSGHKLEAIANNCKVSFCVVGQDTVIPEQYTTHYTSVIAFGTARILEEETEKRATIELLAQKYHPTATADERERAIAADYAPMHMVEISIDHLSGKQALEQVNPS